MVSKFAYYAIFRYTPAVRDYPTQPESHRQRKKRATRTALSDAALRLAIERGLDRVLVDDIAAAANVSPRTFNNYFHSKEAAIVAEGTDRATAIRDALRARPTAEPLWTSLRHVLAEMLAGDREPDRAWVARARLIKSTPALRAEQSKSDAAVEQMLAEEIAQRTGTDSERHLYPHLAASAVISAVRAALNHWLTTDSGTPLAAVVDQAIVQVAGGLSPPGESNANRKARH